MSFWQKVGATILVAVFFWCAVTNVIFQLSNPEVTQTQALLHFPRTIVLDFKP